VGRNTQGVRIIRLKDTENLVRLARIAEPEEEFVIEDDALDNNTALDDNTAEGSGPNEEAAEGAVDDNAAEGSVDDTSEDSSADE
jgi:DNA gyrase subunit A